jgi:hypothetical protein
LVRHETEIRFIELAKHTDYGLELVLALWAVLTSWR